MAGIFTRLVDATDANPRSLLAVEVEDIAAQDQKSPLLGKQRHLISGEGFGDYLPQGWISPHMGQKPR